MQPTTGRLRRRLEIRGQVQGVGFRPCVYRLATARGLVGHVANTGHGATVEIEGTAAGLDDFQRALVEELPPLARITSLRAIDLPPTNAETSFRIVASDAGTGARPEVTPDAATCADCLRELFDPSDRRHGYPFINCTNCGPRYSIIRDVPYDRPKTTMAAFAMCPECEAEYRDPASRRFHAQPNACAVCGPRVRLVTAAAAEHEAGPGFVNDGAIRRAAELLAGGAILGVKGVGGYHLACRADDDQAVQRLRHRKLRDGKPLAVMVPSVEAARQLGVLSRTDEHALRSLAAPIVLVPARRPPVGVSAHVAPGCRDLGLMLPYTPLHHLLFSHGLGPLVMTSANLSGQPLTFRDEDALRELADVADTFLVHDREIFRPIDDSVVFTFAGETIPIRRARGYAPGPIHVATPAPSAVLALGGELKSTICLLRGHEAIVSEHLGDLTNAAAYRHFIEAAGRLRTLFDFRPHVMACDLHPLYLSTRFAREQAAATGVELIAVQHHHAHIASVMAEHGHDGPLVGLSCDGTGHGLDGAAWGCEVLRCEGPRFERLGHLEYFPLIGGDKAAIATWRPAAALLRLAYGPAWQSVLGPGAIKALFRSQRVMLATADQQVERGLNVPPTSSLGRVFDAVAFLLDLCTSNRHEAEAAMALEAAAEGVEDAAPYAYGVEADVRGLRLRLAPALRQLAEERLRGEPTAIGAARFHETVARLLADAARLACGRCGLDTVALSGGCLANRRLLSRLCTLLRESRLHVLFNRAVPAGDGGIALGQAYVAAASRRA